MKEPSFIAPFRKWGYPYLLGSLTLLMLITPLFRSLVAQSFWFELPFVFILITGVWAAIHRPIEIHIAMVLIVVSVLLDISVLLYPGRMIALTSAVIGLLLFGFLTYRIVYGVIVTRRRVTSDMIIGAICGYLLLGISFSFVYQIVTWVDPAAFGGATWVDHPDEPLGPLYFSFVTLSTLGYGDIIPKTLIAKNLVSLQAIAGQMYLAILIARLVGLHIAHEAKSDQGSS